MYDTTLMRRERFPNFIGTDRQGNIVKQYMCENHLRNYRSTINS